MHLNKSLKNLAYVILAGLLFLIIRIGISGIGPEFSTGSRSGFVTQFARTGYGPLQSYEGVLLTSTPKDFWPFKFSLDIDTDPEIIATIASAHDHQIAVLLTYHQWYLRPVWLKSPYQIQNVIPWSDPDQKLEPVQDHVPVQVPDPIGSDPLVDMGHRDLRHDMAQHVDPDPDPAQYLDFDRDREAKWPNMGRKRVHTNQ